MEDSNYFAVWSRDGIKTGLWSMTLNDPDINECFRRTLLLMAEHQTPTGQIPGQCADRKRPCRLRRHRRYRLD